MAVSVSKYLAELGLPVRNSRWSWGSEAGSTVVLRTWEDRYTTVGDLHRVEVLGPPMHRRGITSPGLTERIRHLRGLWSGGKAGYTVVASAKDVNARPRKVVRFLDDGAFFAIERLELMPDGSISAILGEPVKSERLHAHAQRHRTKAGKRAFPLEPLAPAGAMAPWPEAEEVGGLEPERDLAERAARFAQVQLRPEQASFRLAVFNAYRGVCVISGCSVPEALEAAHLRGRNWKAGDNSAEDGLLLRRDLHSLYDRNKLHIDSEGRVAVALEVRHDYGEWHGISVRKPRDTE